MPTFDFTVQVNADGAPVSYPVRLPEGSLHAIALYGLRAMLSGIKAGEGKTVRQSQSERIAQLENGWMPGEHRGKQPTRAASLVWAVQSAIDFCEARLSGPKKFWKPAMETAATLDALREQWGIVLTPWMKLQDREPNEIPAAIEKAWEKYVLAAVARREELVNQPLDLDD